MRYVAFLRGINVSGQKLIKMEALRQHFEMPGVSNIATYIQSGNVLFDTKETDATKLRKKIEKQLALKIGYEVQVVIRSVDEIKAAIENNPFADAGAGDGRKVYIVFLSDVPQASLPEALEAYRHATEVVSDAGRELYILTGGIGNSKLNLNLIEKKAGVVATMRNLATVTKVAGL